MQPKGLYQHEMLSKALLTQLSGVCLSGNCGTSEACAESTHTSLCPASELSSRLWMPTSSSDSAVGTGPRSGNASELDWRTKSSKSTNCRSAPPLARPPAHHEIGPLPSVPEQAPPPYLPAWRHCHPPPRAAPAPPRAAAPPGAPWRRLPRLDPGPGADTDRGRCLRDGPGRCPASQGAGRERL